MMEIFTHLSSSGQPTTFTTDSLPINLAKSTKITRLANPQLAFQAQCGAAFTPAGPSSFKAFIEKRKFIRYMLHAVLVRTVAENIKVSVSTFSEWICRRRQRRGCPIRRRRPCPSRWSLLRAPRHDRSCRRNCRPGGTGL